jgi:hypothetical protein
MHPIIFEKYTSLVLHVMQHKPIKQRKAELAPEIGGSLGPKKS